MSTDFEVRNPATGARLALIAEHTDAELVAAAAACRAAQNAWAATGMAERKAAVGRLRALLADADVGARTK